LDDDAGKIEMVSAEGAEEPRLELIEIGGDHISDALAGAAKDVKEEKVMDERGGVSEASADEDGTAADRLERVDVGAGDEHADGDQGAEGEDGGALGDALGTTVGRVEAEDVCGGRKDDGRHHDVRPVGGEGRIEVLSKPDQDAGESGDIEKNRVQRKME